MNRGPRNCRQEVKEGEAKSSHPHHAGDARHHRLDAGNEAPDDDAYAAPMGKMALPGRQQSMITGEGPNLDKAFLVDATGPIGNRVADGGSKNCRDEGWPE